MRAACSVRSSRYCVSSFCEPSGMRAERTISSITSIVTAARWVMVGDDGRQLHGQPRVPLEVHRVDLGVQRQGEVRRRLEFCRELRNARRVGILRARRHEQGLEPFVLLLALRAQDALPGHIDVRHAALGAALPPHAKPRVLRVRPAVGYAGRAHAQMVPPALRRPEVDGPQREVVGLEALHARRVGRPDIEVAPRVVPAGRGGVNGL